MRTGNKHVVVISLLGIIWLESLALIKGIDGAALSLSIAAISGLGGYGLHEIMDRLRKAG